MCVVQGKTWQLSSHTWFLHPSDPFATFAALLLIIHTANLISPPLISHQSLRLFFFFCSSIHLLSAFRLCYGSFPRWKHSSLTHLWLCVFLVVQSFINNPENWAGRREQMLLLNQRVTWWNIQSPCGKQKRRNPMTIFFFFSANAQTGFFVCMKES